MGLTCGQCSKKATSGFSETLVCKLVIPHVGPSTALIQTHQEQLRQATRQVEPVNRKLWIRDFWYLAGKEYERSLLSAL